MNIQARTEYSVSFKYNDSIVKCDLTEDKIVKIINRLMEYYEKHGYIGEVIHQDDDAILEAPSVLSDICDDIIEFKSEDNTNDI